MVDNVITSIANFALNNNVCNMSDIDIFNKWSEMNNIIIKDINDSKWILEFIKSVKNMDFNNINEALQLDLLVNPM